MQLLTNPDFDAVASAALPLAAAVAARLAPPPHDGQRTGSRYLWRNRRRDDQNLGSAALHLLTGQWADFALPDDATARGHGLVSWAAYLYRIEPEVAERWLGGMLGLCQVDPAAPPEFQPLADAERTFAERISASAESAAPAWFAADLPDHRSGLDQLYIGLRRQHGPPATVFEYRRQDGRPVALVLRWQDGKNKHCRPAIWARPQDQPDAPLRWAPAWPPALPLYHADQLARRPDAPVILLEGEKTADAATRLFPDFVCTAVAGNLHGRADWSLITGRELVIWPDHDESGYRLADESRRRATAAGARSVCLVSLPDHLPLGWDIADALPAGWTTEHLRRLVGAARARERSTGPDLSLLDIGRRSVPSIDGVLPSWSAWIDTACKAKSVPADYVISALLGVGSGAIAGLVNVEVRPGWVEPGILNVVLVGDSAAGKTPALETVEVGLEAMERAFRADFDLARTVWETDPEAKPEEKPTLRRCRIEDTSVEAAAMVLAREGRGLLGWMPEMTAWLSGLTRYRQQGSNDRGFWLKAYDGKPTAVDRRKLGDDPIMVPALAVPVLGGLQPDLVPMLLHGHIDDGLGARFLLAWPDPVISEDVVSDEIWSRAESFIATALSRLHTAADKQAGENPLTGRRELVTRLSDSAQARFSAWRQDYLTEQRRRHGAAIPAFAGKAPGHVARLAVVLHCLEWAAGRDSALPRVISDATLATAIELRTGFFEAHRERAELDAGEPSAEKLARALARHLVDTGTEVIDTAALRRHARLPGLRTEGRLRTALTELQTAGWLAAGTKIPRQDKDPLPAVVQLRQGLLALLAGRR